MTDIVLIGGGHTHALVLQRWGTGARPTARVTLVSPERSVPYTGMLPGYVAGHYPREALRIDLVRLCAALGATFVQGRACGLDLRADTVTLEDASVLPFDLLSLDVGIHGQVDGLPGLAEHGVSAKPLDPFASAWDRFVRAALHKEEAPEAAVIGGGVAGAELALAMAHRLRHERGAKVTIIERSDGLLRGANDRTRRSLEAALTRWSVRVLTGTSIEAVSDRGVRLSGGGFVPSRLTVAATGPAPYAWLEKTGLALEEGYVAVDRTLRASGQTKVFAAGDCAHLTASPRDKAGVFAVREAPVLAENLRRAAEGRARLKRYHPQRDYMKLISMGDRRAVLERGPLSLSGGWAWQLKDAIDRRFIEKLTPTR